MFELGLKDEWEFGKRVVMWGGGSISSQQGQCGHKYKNVKKYKLSGSHGMGLKEKR